MKRTLAVILAGGEGARLSILSEKRAKPAVPFAGKFRIIDFALSNCVNSDIDNVAVLTQYNPRSLSDHIGSGRPCHVARPQCEFAGNPLQLRHLVGRADHCHPRERRGVAVDGDHLRAGEDVVQMHLTDEIGF